MNNIRTITLLLSFSFLCGCATPTPQLSYQEDTEYLGITYLRKDDIYGTTAHVVDIDPKHYQLRLIKADALEYTSVLAKNHNAIVAINAGFFHEDGSPVGPLKIENTWLGNAGKKRGAFGWNNKSHHNVPSFYFDRLGQATMHSGIWNKLDNVVGGIPLLLKDGKIINPAPEGALTTFIQRKYARSAICVNKKKHIIFAVIEGADNFSWSLGTETGMSINELSRFFLSIGCTDAINLDGGRSSTLVLENQMVNTQPLIHTERKVSDVLAIVPNS
jgi:exopolysaccharide biosynthesis protein